MLFSHGIHQHRLLLLPLFPASMERFLFLSASSAMEESSPPSFIFLFLPPAHGWTRHPFFPLRLVASSSKTLFFFGGNRHLLIFGSSPPSSSTAQAETPPFSRCKQLFPSYEDFVTPFPFSRPLLIRDDEASLSQSTERSNTLPSPPRNFVPLFFPPSSFRSTALSSAYHPSPFKSRQVFQGLFSLSETEKYAFLLLSPTLVLFFFSSVANLPPPPLFPRRESKDTFFFSKQLENFFPSFPSYPFPPPERHHLSAWRFFSSIKH